MHRFTSLRNIGVFALALCLITALSFAQTTNGTIAGVVTDATGAVVQNASVTAKSTTTGETHTDSTNDLGAYRLESVSPGTYIVTVKAGSFADLKIENVIVKTSLTSTVNASLKAGSQEVVTVEGAAQELQTENGEISHSISSTEITQLPVLNLNPLSLALTQPGIVAPSSREDFTNGMGFSVNGTRPRANNFLIEGQDNNDASIQGQAIQVTNIEAVQEISVLTNSYAAEFGHGGGSVSNLNFKSGTNSFHGSAYELHQNSALDSTNARDRLNNVPKAKTRENTFGFTFGGPIRKDKLFIFGASQWDRTRQAANGLTLTLPTANGVATLQSLLPNPNVANYLAAIGSLRGQTNITNLALGGGRPSVEVGKTARSGVAEPSNDYQLVVKSDYLVTSKDNLTLRYTYDRNDLTPDFFNFARQLPGFDTQQGGTAHNGGIIETHTFTPSVVNEFRASYGRIGFSFAQTPQTLSNALAALPSVSISGLTGFGVPTNIPQGRFHNTYQYQDSVSWNKGTHAMKFGVDFARLQVRDAVPFNFRGSITYGSGGGFTSLANFVDNFLGVNGSLTQTFGNPTVRPYFFNQNYFAQDTWKMRSNLTVSYGVRYENGGSPANVMPFPAIDVRLGAFDPVFPRRVEQQSDNNNFAPRLSFAYTPRFWSKVFGEDKTVIRAGYGMFYDTLFTNIIDNIAGSSPNAISPLINGTPGRGQANASNLFATFAPVPSATASVSTIANNLVAPITHQWNFDIERELPGNFALTTAYVGSRGIRLFANDQFNPGNGDFVHRIVRTRGSIQVRDNSADSIYHGLDVKLDRRFSHGLLLRTSYTYSKLIDDASEVFTTTGTSSFPADLTLGHHGIDRGLSAFDRRHRVVVAYIYDIPQFRNDNNLGFKSLGYLINGWQISGTFAYQSGAPETVTDGFDANGDLQANDRPNLGNPNAPITSFAYDGSQIGLAPAGTFCDGQTFNSKGTCATVTDLSTVHWIIPANGVGNVGRNTQVAPGRQDWTFGVQRTIKLHEQHELEFRTEMFNPFNHPNTINAPFNLLTNTQGPSTTFGNYGLTVVGERDIRFKLKYMF